MKKNNLTISIGIPAFNEDANIKQLLENLLEKNSNGFELKEIIVVSDSSTDNTVEKVLEVKDRRIKIIKNQIRLGQAKSQNKILKMFSGDVLVLLNADVLPTNRDLIKNIISPFYSDNKIGIVGGKVVPLPAQNFIESVLNFSVLIKQSVYEQVNNGDNAYLCHGRVRAFSKEFAKKFSWKEVVAEDAYSYLFCKRNNYKFYYQRSAQINYRSPQSLKDHLKQSTRFYENRRSLEKYFPKKLVGKSFFIPKYTLIKISLSLAIKNPLKAFAYIIILSLAKLQTKVYKNQNIKWESSISSKGLVK